MKKLLALVLALVMTMSLVTISNAAFKDADKIDNDEAVEVMNAIGVLVGDEKGNFNAKENLTREQAAKIISYLLLGNKTAEALVGAAKFTDVAATRWSAGFVDYCASTGVVAGNGDGTFAPAGQLTGFQFAKMLLVALGYDANIEGFTGTDWQINVSKVANQVGLFDGLSISGTAVLTREQAAQMCLNTLKAPLVQYSNKGGNLTINGTVIGVAPSSAEYVTTTLAKEQRISDRTLTNTTAVNGGYTVEFGEKYYSKLVLKNDQSDDFGRPAHTWLYDNETIGTYAEAVDFEYTTSVVGKDLYAALGKDVVEGKDAYDFTVYVDGAEDNTLVKDIVKNNKDNVTGTGKGVLTQVFIDNDAETVVITLVNTYLAQAQSDYNAKKDNVTFDLFGAPVASKAVSGEDFDIEDVKDEEFYLVTYSKMAGVNAIKSVAKAEIIEDTTIDSFKSGKNGNITVAGTKYSYDKTATYKKDVLDNYTGDGATNLKDITYNIYLDQYGYVIGVEEVEAAKNYVFVTGVDANSSNLSTKTFTANALFIDGTSKVIDVKNTEAFRDSLPDDRTVKESGKDVTYSQLPLVNTWYTYTVNSSDVYTLTVVAGSITGNKVAQFDNGAGGKAIDKKNISLNDGETKPYYAYGNDATVYLTAKTDTVKTNSHDYTVISGVDNVTTGVRNASLTTKAAAKDYLEAGGVYVLYKDNGYIIAAVVVGEDSFATKNLVYLNNSAVASESYNKTTDKWTWTINAIQDGEEVTLTETNDSGVSVLKKMAKDVADAKHNLWFVVKFYADGTVYSAEKAESLKNATKGTKWVDTLGNAVTAVVSDNFDTVLLDGAYAYTKKNIELIGNSLQDKTTDNRGLFVDDDVKVVLIQKVDNKTTTTYDKGVKVLESTLKNLNDEKDINFYFNAIVEDGAVKTVIIRDFGKDGYTENPGTTSSKLSDVKLSYDSTGKKYTVTFDVKGYTAYTPLTVELYTANGYRIGGDMAAEIGNSGDFDDVSRSISYTAVNGAGLYDVVITLDGVAYTYRCEVV